MIYEADKPVELKYITKDGDEKSYDFTPTTDMNRPQIIMMLKNQDKNFLKLLESDNKMGKHYIKLESTFTKPEKAENVTEDVSYIVLQDSTIENPEDGMMDILVFEKTMSEDDYDRVRAIIDTVKTEKPDDYDIDDIVDAIDAEFNIKDHMEVSNSKAMYMYY